MIDPPRLPPVLVSLIIVTAGVLVAALGSIAFLLTDWDAPRLPGPPVKTAAVAHRIRFEVTGAGTAQRINWTVTWDSATVDDARLPWSTELVAGQPTPLAAITVIKPGASVRCRLLVDGKVIVDREARSEVSCEAAIDS